MYKVVRAFFDSTDNDRLYKVGDTYPAEGAKATKKRIDELVKGTNKNGKVYIKEAKVEKPVEPPKNEDNGNAGNTDNGNAGNTDNGNAGNAPQNPEE